MIDSTAYHKLKKVGSLMPSKIFSVAVSFLIVCQALVAEESPGPLPSFSRRRLENDFVQANVRYIELVQTKNYLQISELAVYDYHGTNIAVNKSTTASTAFRGDFCSYDSANAVDGIARNKMFNNCSLHAYHSQSTYSTFWKLDLGSDSSVRSIVYYNRGDCCQERAIGATLNAYNSTNHLVATWSLNGDLIQTFNQTYSPETVTAAKKSSEFSCNVAQPSWIGDHYCDSTGGYNTAACNWDGGDCCSQTCDGTIYNECNTLTFPRICLNPLYQ
eukprot:gene4001-7971_t